MGRKLCSFSNKRIFFDGERLDNYFKEVKGQNVKNQIFILSHIHILESMEKRIDQIFKELRRKAGNLTLKLIKKRKLEEKQKTQ